MDALTNDFGYIKLIYGSMLLPFVIFGGVFLVLKGKDALKPGTWKIGKGTIASFSHNLLLVPVNSLLFGLFFASVGLLSNYIYSSLGVPHIPETAWVGLPGVLVFIIVLLGIDFTNYWSHKILHTKLFWGVHSLHHSDEHMNWSTVYRIHVLEAVIMKITFVFVLGWMFLPPEIIGLAAMARSWYSKFIHCQIGWTYGKFRKIVASPNYHRWHHSIEPEAYGKNLADLFPVWDILFGTHYDPGLCETKLGAHDAPKGFIDAQLYPFKYWAKGIKNRLPVTVFKNMGRIRHES